MITCSNCKTQNEEGSLFCGECGSSLKIETITTTEIQTSISEPITNSETKKIDEIHCRNCGKILSADAFACIGCGLPPYKGKNNCHKCGAATHQDAVICIKCGIKLEGEAPQQISSKQQNSVASIFGTSQVSNQATNNNPNRQNNVVVIGGQKSMVVAVLLAFFFGPLGLMYASVPGGLILMLVGLIGLIIWPLLLIPWLASIIWAIVAVSNQNSKLNKTANKFINS
jgi:uncharacterized membrane protein YvbJ